MKLCLLITIEQRMNRMEFFKNKIRNFDLKVKCFFK
jgi:hypothetical protein